MQNAITIGLVLAAAAPIAVIITHTLHGWRLKKKIDDEWQAMEACSCASTIDINCPVHGLYRGSYFAGGTIEPGQEIPAVLPRGEYVLSPETVDVYKEFARDYMMPDVEGAMAQHMKGERQTLAVEVDAEAMRERFRNRHPNMAEAWEREIGMSPALGMPFTGYRNSVLAAKAAVLRFGAPVDEASFDRLAAIRGAVSAETLADGFVVDSLDAIGHLCRIANIVIATSAETGKITAYDPLDWRDGDEGEPLPAAMLAPPNIGGDDHPEYGGPNYVAPEEIAEEMKTLPYWDRISQHIYDEWVADQVAAGKIVFPDDTEFGLRRCYDEGGD